MTALVFLLYGLASPAVLRADRRCPAISFPSYIQPHIVEALRHDPGNSQLDEPERTVLKFVLALIPKGADLAFFGRTPVGVAQTYAVLFNNMRTTPDSASVFFRMAIVEPPAKWGTQRRWRLVTDRLYKPAEVRSVEFVVRTAEGLTFIGENYSRDDCWIVMIHKQPDGSYRAEERRNTGRSEDLADMKLPVAPP
jgi:hypothetical protein